MRQRPADSPILRRLPGAGLAVALLASIAVSFASTVGKPDCQDLDFGAYYRAAVAVHSGQTPYTVDEHGPMGSYPYAPAYAYLLIPLQYLDYLWACRAWMVLNWLAAAGIVVVTARLLADATGQRISATILVGALFPVAGYFWANIRVGQAGLFVLLGCLAAFAGLHSRRSVWGGVALATACMLKLAPLALLPALALQKAWRGLAGVAIGLVVLFLVPVPWVGWSRNLELHGEWLQHCLATQVPVQSYRPGNQSILAQLARLPAISNGHECYSTEHLQWLCRWYPVLLVGLTLVVHGLIVWHRRKRGPQQELCRRRQELVYWALLLVFVTLASPRAWRCNFVALFLPSALVAERIGQRGPGRFWYASALFAVLLATLWPTNGVGEGSWNLGSWVILGKHFWGAVVLGVACAATAWRKLPTNHASWTQAGGAHDAGAVSAGLVVRPARGQGELLESPDAIEAGVC